MIVSKPKPHTFIALSAVLALLYAGVVFVLVNYVKSPTKPIWLLALFLVLAPLTILINIKLLLTYKTVQIGAGQIEIYYLGGMGRQRISMQKLSSWSETEIKTPTGMFKQLTIQFAQHRPVHISMQEHTNYDKVVALLKKNAASKRIQPKG